MTDGGTTQPVPKLKAIGGSIAFLVLGAVAAFLLLALTLIFLPALDPSTLATDPPPLFPLLQGIVLILAFSGAMWLVGIRWGGLSRAALGLVPARSGLQGFLRGCVIGGAPAALAMILAVPLGGARWVLDGAGLAAYGQALAEMTGALFPAALSEELIFRGTPLVLCAAAFSRSWAIGAMAVLFALAHLANPGLSVLALVNIALAGVLLGVAFFLPGGLWSATGVHLGWNLTLAALAAPISGLPFVMPGLDYGAGRPSWLTGGGFGPEGGLLATGALLLIIGALVPRMSKESTA